MRETRYGGGWKRSSIARIPLRATTLLLYDLPRVYFEGRGRNGHWPMMERAGISEAIGVKSFFSIAVHA
ncbi:hypothetical protein [Candidatus Methylacidithermus pantelleriae]|nr:hypothetical protein [Candidatus Methylacidithermus pantelleriae]